MNAGELKDYYGLLGIKRNSTVSEIHKAYWKVASRCHPDMGGSHEDMVQVVEAWKILSDPTKRARYDQLLKYRYDGWHSKKFNEDVQDARKRAKADSDRSWAEFEEIYQKAFYTFNQDFYGEDINGQAAGPYSPLMGSKSHVGQGQNNSNHSSSGTVAHEVRSRMVNSTLKIVILIVLIVAALFYYRNYSGVGRYVPLGEKDGLTVIMLDTATGAVYAVDKRIGNLSQPWKTIVPPLSKEIKSPVK